MADECHLLEKGRQEPVPLLIYPDRTKQACGTKPHNPLRSECKPRRQLLARGMCRTGNIPAHP